MADLTQAMQATLSGEQTEFTKSVVWNSGFYLWRCGVYMSVAEGISHAQEALATGKVQAKLDELKAAIASHTSTVQV
jgi:anthranilate phosphoribosyltransferase